MKPLRPFFRQLKKHASTTRSDRNARHCRRAHQAITIPDCPCKRFLWSFDLQYSRRMHPLCAALLAACLVAPAAARTPYVSEGAAPAPAAPMLDRQPDGMVLHLSTGELRIQVLSESVIRVAFSASPDFPSRAS